MQDVPGAYPRAPSTDRQSFDQPDQLTSLSLLEGVRARRAEYVRPKQIRIKVGTWNVAAHKGTDQDVAGWFVEGRGVAEGLSELHIGEGGEASDVHQSREASGDAVEGAMSQEADFPQRESSLPKGDRGVELGDHHVDLYLLGLQEVVDINSTSEALRPYTDPSVAKKYKDNLQNALPQGYHLVAEQQLIGLLLLVYASAELTDEVKAISTTSVGTGLMGYMGNKGAVTARIVIGDTTRLVFVNSHLAAGADKASCERRNWDAAQIIQRTRFDPIKDAMDLAQTTGEQIGDEDFAFWVGDLNYRLETIPGDDVRRLLMLHTRNEYDLGAKRSDHKIDEQIEEAAKATKHQRKGSSLSSSSSASIKPSQASKPVPASGDDSGAPAEPIDDILARDDPASLQTTLSSLLTHDELHNQMRTKKAFYDGWQEGSIHFLPTYKYDRGSVGVFDSSEKKRAPSWCDRILFRTRKAKLAYETKAKEEESAKKRDDEMRASGTDQAGDDDEILYNYDPDTDGADPNDDYDEHDDYDTHNDTANKTQNESEPDEQLKIEYYTAHQRVLTSDHKPLDAVFTLQYDAVIPSLKAKIHAEVAKELDKLENEGRPNVTVVVDQQHDKSGETSDDGPTSFEGVSFGDVKWNQLKTRSVTIANTSRVPAAFKFIERPAGPDHISGIAPTWLDLRLNGVDFPSSVEATAPHILHPGETASVELRLRITGDNFVRDLNDGKSELDDVLVLRVDGGRDHFIPIKGHWLSSTLGQKIEKLIRLPEGGIRKLQNQMPDKSKSSSKTRSVTDSDDAEERVRCSAPRELFRLTEAIEALVGRIVPEWDMISSPSEVAPWIHHAAWPFEKDCWQGRLELWWQEVMGEVCDALDNDRSVSASFPPELSNTQRLYILSDFLLYFLESMPCGIISEEQRQNLDNYLHQLEKTKHHPTNEEQRTAIHEILSTSSSRSISFIMLMTMLERLQQEIVMFNAAHDNVPVSPSVAKLSSLRRVTGSFTGTASTTSAVDHSRTALARIFAPAVFGTPVTDAKKPGAAQDRRSVELIKIFLTRNGNE